MRHALIPALLGAFLAVPLRAAEAERFLAGKQPAGDVIAEAARLAVAGAAPNADRRGSVEFKREVARVLTARALRRALERARGEQ